MGGLVAPTSGLDFLLPTLQLQSTLDLPVAGRIALGAGSICAPAPGAQRNKKRAARSAKQTGVQGAEPLGFGMTDLLLTAQRIATK